MNNQVCIHKSRIKVLSVLLSLAIGSDLAGAVEFVDAAPGIKQVPQSSPAATASQKKTAQPQASGAAAKTEGGNKLTELPSTTITFGADGKPAQIVKSDDDVSGPQATVQRQLNSSINGTPTPSALINSIISSRQNAQSLGEMGEDGSISVKPGETQVLQISRNALNRFVTPFKKAKVKTIDDIEAVVDGGVVYISTQSNAPIGVYIVDADSMDAINLQLLPADIPLREIRLKLDPGYKRNNKNAATPNTAKAESYTTAIADIFTDLALGRIPAGFSTSKHLDGDIACFMPGFKFDQEQLFVGADEKLAVFVAENKSEQVLEIAEQGCYSINVEAVAAFPRVMLEPGEKTEVYVLKRVVQDESAGLAERKVLVR
jgi:hypothetical protein